MGRHENRTLLSSGWYRNKQLLIVSSEGIPRSLLSETLKIDPKQSTEREG